jgi:hypothetical protein
MKLVAFIFIFAAFLGISAFGLLTMQMDSGHSSCMVSVQDDCAGIFSPLATVSEHFSLFGALSLALVIAAGTTALFLCGWLLYNKKTGHSSHCNARPAYTRSTEQSSPSLSQRKFIEWLSFHENSPSCA